MQPKYNLKKKEQLEKSEDEFTVDKWFQMLERVNYR